MTLDEIGGDDAPPGRLRPGLRVYAVGDIHGHADLLGRIATLIDGDLAKSAPEAAVTVFVGDYIDRGPASAAVIDRLKRGDFPTPIVTLRGNHEQMLLDTIDDVDAMRDWLINGGLETAESYGLVLDRRYADPAAFREALLSALPKAHLDFLNNTALHYSVDGYLFVHAGIRPGVPMERQQPEDLLWIREAFHRSDADHGKVVVHGHTPVAKPESLPNRINIDTGAFKTGRLTCLALDGDRRRFFST